MVMGNKMSDTALTKAEEKVAAKVLIEQGYSSREIEQWLGVSDSSALRYAKEETPEALTQFEAEFKEAIEEKKKEGLGMVMKRIQEIIPKYPRLDHLVKAAEYFEGKSGGGNTLIVIPILGKETEVK